MATDQSPTPVCSWQSEVGGWQSEVGGWQSEVDTCVRLPSGSLWVMTDQPLKFLAKTKQDTGYERLGY